MGTKVKRLFATRQRRVRFKLKQKAGGRLRLSIFKSNKHIYAQVIDDGVGKTIAYASTLEKGIASMFTTKNRANIEGARAVGRIIAMRAIDVQIKDVVFDRGGYLYHGCVKALADAAREHGLNF